jgi:hypothetical protein
MTFPGHVQNGVVVFDGPQTPPEGARVEVAILPREQTQPLRDFLLEFAGTFEDLPNDMAQQPIITFTDGLSDDDAVCRYVLFYRC